MRLFTFRQMSIAAASLVCAVPAFAATQVQTSTFNFSMSRNPNEVDCYDGADTKTFNPFDTQGGTRTLDKVTLDLNMNISGTLIVSSAQPDVLPLQEDGNDGKAPIEIELTGAAEAGPASNSTPVLTTQAVFPNVEDDGRNGFVNINENGTGSQVATSNFSSFVGSDPIDVDLSAVAMVVYNDVGQIGAAEQLAATGDVTLTYGYSAAGNPTPTVPAPAALGGGLMLLGGLMLSRRRAWLSSAA